MRIDVYINPADAGTRELAESLPHIFQLHMTKEVRTGYGKCLNVNERTLAALCGRDSKFAFRVCDVSAEPLPMDPKPIRATANVFAKLPAAAADRTVMGMDIGGTDVKLAVSVSGQLAIFKEFDWFPASFSRAEQIIEPLVLLTRLLRAATSLYTKGRSDEIDQAALSRNATMAEMQQGIATMEAAAGTGLQNFDAIGLCFPDVVIRNQIVGGETYKTRGMRENRALDYDEQFSKLTNLCSYLQPFVTPDGFVMNTNDGPMAAFTTAVEQAAAGLDVSNGFFAHTLGTELGAGWVRPDGSIPEIPLEVYNFIVDLGSFGQKGYAADDIRSINNFNTGLPGTLQKYACQSGVFRLAAKVLPTAAPDIWREAFNLGLFAQRDGKIVVPTEPLDMRKPCLEFFMTKATEPEQTACAEIFRKVGESLGACWSETTYILQPETEDRTLFGRLVKNPICFQLLCEGANRLIPGLRQFAADGTLANTPLMQQLEAHPDYTVAQFAQAIGAIYYGCLPFV